MERRTSAPTQASLLSCPFHVSGWRLPPPSQGPISDTSGDAAGILTVAVQPVSSLRARALSPLGAAPLGPGDDVYPMNHTVSNVITTFFRSHLCGLGTWERPGWQPSLGGSSRRCRGMLAGAAVLERPDWGWACKRWLTHQAGRCRWLLTGRSAGSADRSAHAWQELASQTPWQLASLRVKDSRPAFFWSWLQKPSAFTAFFGLPGSP